MNSMVPRPDEKKTVLVYCDGCFRPPVEVAYFDYSFQLRLKGWTETYDDLNEYTWCPACSLKQSKAAI